MTMTRGWAVWVVVAGCIGCGSSNDRPLTFAWVPKSLGNPVFEAGRDGAALQAMKLTQIGPRMVTSLYTAPPTEDAAAQAQMVKDLTKQKVDGIAISVLDADLVGPAIDSAVAAGVPVMTFDSDAVQSQRFTYLGVNNQAGGQAAAKMLVKAMASNNCTTAAPCKVAILTGGNAPNLEARVMGFTTELANHPELSLINTIHCAEDQMLCAMSVEQQMGNAPPDGWFFAGIWQLFLPDTAMPTWNSAARAGKMKTVAFDTIPQTLAYVSDGRIQALVGQKYWGWGYDSMKMLYDKVVSHATFQSFTDSGMDLVCMNNVAAMQAAWTSHQFEQALPTCTLAQ
jgi:ribose transport system substrate-binding protein